MKPRQVRWSCPNGCPGVLAPTKPRRDDVRRYCLACSAKSGRLVERASTALERARQARADRVQAANQKSLALRRFRLATYYTIAGVNVLDEVRLALKAPIFRGMREPSVLVRTRRTGWVGTYGRAWYSRHMILINRREGADAHDVRETILHELAHLRTGTFGHRRNEGPHGAAWRNNFRLACEQVLNVRPRLEVRTHGEVARLLREQALAETAADSSEPEVK
jgi:predicted SprT family Zn-dependent metalloprotease